MLRRHPLAFFFALAYGLSWAAWAPLVLAEWGTLPVRPTPYLHLLGSLGPAAAAFATARAFGGRAALRDLAGRLLRWRVPLVWHGVAWLAPLALFFVSVVVAWLVWGQSWDAAAFGRSAEYPGMPLLVYWAVSVLFYGYGEETGWRGFALPHLQAGRSALAATLLLSLGWALWHVPLFVFSPGLSQMDAAGVAGWLFSIVTGAILFTWLFNGTQGSVLVAAVFHGTMDVVFLSPEPPSVAGVLGALVTVWGLAVLVLRGPRCLARAGKMVAAYGGPPGIGRPGLKLVPCGRGRQAGAL
ncbi:MAG: type II CAAX prenyl endopeptidase Rce1 family protein [Rubricoccaceae bacterium]